MLPHAHGDGEPHLDGLQGPSAPDLCGDVLGDLPAVKAAILDEDLVGARAGDDDACEIDARDVALQALRIAGGAAILAFDADAELLQKSEIGMVAGEGEDEVIFD